MKTVKRIEKDGFVLTHSWYVDHSGLKRNSFDLFHVDSRVHMSFFVYPRLITTKRYYAYGGDDVSPYTDKQYQEMFDIEVSNFNKHYETTYRNKRLG